MNIETANRLVQLRKENGLSQEALAAKLGVSRQAVSKWERAEASPDTDNLIALAELYGMTLDGLLNTMNDKYVLSTEEKPEEKPEKISQKVIRKGKEIINSALYPEVAKAMFKFPYPIVIALVYVIICWLLGKTGVDSEYTWGRWWLLFLTIPMYYMVAAACRTTSKKAFLFCMPVPIVVVTLYLMLGLFFDLWAAGALIFIAIPLYYWYVIFYVKGKNKKNKENPDAKKNK